MIDSCVPEVRVYLLTYQRNHLLPRALNSLLAQTYTNWICEVHNDDPSDPFPERLVVETNDPRVSYRAHARNLGPIANFNHVFQPVAEKFVSLLEDDNWWEPRLLERLLAAITPFPSINIAWANAHIWRETAAGDWQREGTIWPVGDTPVTIFETPSPCQACRMLHSQGAMILRVTPETMVPTPPATPLVAIEPVRERVYGSRLLLVREALSNFAITVKTARRETADENMQVMVLLASTVMKRCPDTAATFDQMWKECRGDRGHRHRALIVAAYRAGRLGRLLGSASAGELAVVAAWALRHPLRFANLFKAAGRFPDVLQFLEAAGARNDAAASVEGARI
jgi:glycosyltransferase involved in cell wall biosynthesis